MFRASPWITYDPPASDSQPSQPMDNDTEMDAPQISTLHDDGESPPSNASPARTGKFRVKLLVNEAKMGTKFITFNGETGEEARVAEEVEEDEPDDDEEDELMEDEAADGSTGTPAGASASGSGGAGATKSGTKRASTKTKTSQARRKARLNAPATAPTSLPAPAPSEMQDNPSANDVQDAPPSVEPASTAASEATPPAVSAPASKKKVVPKGTTPAQRAPRKSAPKPKTAAASLVPAMDAAGDVSEGHAGTVPSSPAPIEARTPDPEPAPPQDSTSAFASSSIGGAPEPTTIEDIEGVPHPRYPLPTKPFQVQPPPKITTGYAPTTPLDRTKGKPRHWRPAHREIRGIAGGRWFARTWVGEKDSELATATEAALSLPKLPALSISAPASGARTPGKRKPKATDANSTAASSRSASAAPEGTAPAPPLQRSTAKKSALSTAVAASEVEMDIDLVS